MKKVRVLIAGGGTGGHLFPGMSIAEELAERFPCDIRFVGTSKGIESRILPQTDFKLYTIPISGLYRVGIKRKIQTLLKLPIAFLKSLKILIIFRPNLVIGIGGYASGPVLALALLLRKNTVIQEQNAYPGMTNRLLGKYVQLAFVPFKRSESLFKHPVIVGNPIRKAIRVASPSTHQKIPGKIVIAIVGGSQGARVINKTVAERLPVLNEKKLPIKIVHQTGKWDFDWLKAQYGQFDQVEADVVEFIDDMVSLYQQSHLFICRAGSMINEIIAMGKASILVPIAISSGDHQRENARLMADAGAAIMIEEKDLTSESLFGYISEFVKNPQDLITMGNKARGLYQGDSAEKIVSAIQSRFNLT